MKSQAKNLKSKVMKAAWTIFRKYKVSSMANWSKALKRAWAWAKEKVSATSTYIYFDFVLKETEKAYCLRREDKICSGCYTKKDLWIPKSLATLGRSEVIVPMWFAKKLVEQGTLSNIDILH